MRMASLRLCVVVYSLALAAPSAGQQPAGPRHASVKMEAGDACLACHKKVAEHPVVHMPVAAAACDECHTPPAGKPGAIGLKAGATRERTAPLCISCHEGVGAATKLSGVHAPVATGDCISCHDPHGADVPFLLRAKTSELCLSCHDTVAEAIKQSSPHAPAVANCTLCHDAHGTPHRLQLRAVVNPLCQSCHLGTPPAAGSKAAVVFGRELAADETKFLRDAKRISLEPLGRFGHPSFSHPVTGAFEAARAGKTSLTCVSCHQPHGAGTRQLFQFGAGGATDLCINCHK